MDFEELLALPVMIERGYEPRLSTGTIAASGTQGILIPPSIMLVIMADLLGRSVGNLFVAAVFPDLMLASLYFVYIIVRCTLNPKLDANIGPQSLGPVLIMVLRSFIPPVIEQLDFGDHVARIDMVYWFAILLAVSLQTSFLTPPFGFALFYMKAVAPKSIKIQQI